ncbi:MAG: hypothetical protein ACYTHK_01095, partial [Planctomycetota bacterium]
DNALGCDAYLVDTERTARPLRLATELPADRVVAEILDRTVLMGRSLFEVRGMTFALFVGADPFTVAMSEPVADGVLSMLRDTLACFGAVTDGEPVRLEEAGLHPLLAYEEGKVSFFDSAPTRPWRAIAGNRGLRILAATPTHDPDPDVEIRACDP